MLRHASQRRIFSFILGHQPSHSAATSLNLQKKIERHHSHQVTDHQLKAVGAILNALPPLPSAIHNASEIDIKTVNDALPVVCVALAEKNVLVAWKSWSRLVNSHLLRLVGRSVHEKHSRLLAAICDGRNSQSPSRQEEVLALEEMSLVAAVAGYPTGFTACMLLHIERNDANSVHRLYSRYLEMLEERERWIAVESNNHATHSSDPVFSSHSQVDVDASGHQVANEAESNARNPSSRSLDLPLIFPDILLCSIAASAMQDDFLGALRTMLQTGTRIGKHHIARFTDRISFDVQLSRKVAHYGKKLDLARIVARPMSLTVQVTNLTKDRADYRLQTLYGFIMAELRAPNPWLTTDPSKVSETTPIVLPDYTWGLFLKGFLHCRKFGLAEKLWDDLTVLGSTPTLETWAALLSGYGELGLGQPLLSVWNLMREQNISPDISAYRALIEGLCHAKMPKEALHHFRQFRNNLAPAQLQDPATRSLHNGLVHGLLVNSEVTEAYAVLQLMRKEQPRPDIGTYNTFLHHYENKGDLKGLASVLEQVDESGLCGDVVTFSTILTALLKVRQDAPQIVFDLMRKQGVKPNIVMYSGIIDHLMKQKNPSSFKAALDILRTIEQDPSEDVAPNVVTYTSVLNGILRADWLDPSSVEEWRADITRRMQQRQVRPDAGVYKVLIEAAMDNPTAQGVQHALMYYREVPKRIMTNDIWYVLLLGLSRREEWAIAEELIVELEKSQFIPHQSLAGLVTRVKRKIKRKT